MNAMFSIIDCNIEGVAMLPLMLRAQWLTLKQDSMDAPSGLRIPYVFKCNESRNFTKIARLAIICSNC